MSKYHPKTLSSKFKEHPNSYTKPPEQERLESEKSRPTPRFSSDTVGKRQTAKKHSFSMPDRMGHENSYGPDKLIPGAFPVENHYSLQAQKDLNSAILPGGRHGVRVGTGIMLQDNVDGSGEPDKSQLPTYEQPSLSSVGVGSLPGSIKEPGVAILPEERTHPDPYLRGYTTLDAANLRTGRRPPNKASRREYELPTTEQPSGSRVGIGSMPGTIHEAGVATLPEERIDGRPYGSGHTGFEATLGKGNSIREVHPTSNVKPGRNASDGNPKDEQVVEGKNNMQSSSRSDAKLTIDEEARKALHERNPIPLPPAKGSTVNPDSSTAEQSLPGDTIFSATQRAKAHDPNFVHSLGSQAFVDRSAGESITPTPSKQGNGAKNHLTAQRGEGLHNAAHMGSSVIESVEDAALGAIHGAEHMFHNIESSARAYFPDVSRQGAENVLHNIELGAKAHMPKVAAFFSGGSESTPSSSQNQRNLASYNGGTSSKGGSFITSGVEAPHSKSKDFVTFGSQRSSPVRNVNEPSNDENVPSGIRRPQGVEAEYFNRGEYDIYGESLDTHQFIYDDDFTTEEEGSLLTQESDPLPSKADIERDLASDNARGSYAPGDGMQAKTNSPDVLYGLGGVGFYREGREGVLPGYPTPEGMNKLISDRLKDDHLRESAASNSPKGNSYASKAEAIQGPVAEGPSLDTDQYEDDIALVHRDPEELKEVPIFRGGVPTASGKFEATFKRDPDKHLSSEVPSNMYAGNRSSIKSDAMQGPVAEGVTINTDQYQNDITLVNRDPEEVKEFPIFEGGVPTASGKFEAVFEPVSGQRQGIKEPMVAATYNANLGPSSKGKMEYGESKYHQASQDVPTSGGLKVGYLGKPVSEEEKAIELEKARRAAARRMGIN